MSDFNYDTYCGLYCGACSIMKAHQSGIKDSFACFFNDEAGMELKCHGCKTEQVFQNCAHCVIRACAREKAVERCLECADYPCQNFEFMQFLTEKLPHWNTAAANRQTIQSQGVSRWLEEQTGQWKCPDCQTGYSWYATHCSTCGKDLGEIKPYKNTFDKSIFQMLKPPNPNELLNTEVVFKLEGMDKVRIQKDIVYRVEEGTELLLDLYFPPSLLQDQKLPLVILIHGEAADTNIKDWGAFTSMGRILAASGLAAAAFNHRTLLQGFQIKDAISDIENLKNFLIDHADEYGLDKNHIAIWSFSMGVPFGLYAGIHNSPAYIKCIVAYYGFCDLTSLCQLFKGAINSDGLDEQAEEYSPAQLLSQQPDKIAPMLIARAGMDQIPMLLNSLDNFIGAALANNIQIDVYNHPTGVHAFELLNDVPRTHEIIEKTLEFLKRHLSTL
ncbi:MAG TPA: DUF3795 domain-containing protein [Syntrophomonadaceae bacterium]|nr:DUF3795 domain-containing protein [Syntrophomonadaceae bacterium]